MADRIDALVVGAGVVGLAVARALSLHGLEVVVVERNLRRGEETSSRNSGVIHSGIYYPAGSLKARTCVAGRERLYAYCAAHGIPHQRFGKLIVAQEHQLPQLHALAARAKANGVDDLQLLSGAEVLELEPAVRCGAALLSPSTGIIDVHELMAALQGDLEANAGQVVIDAELMSARIDADGMLATVRSGGELSELACRWLVNSAGLHALGLLERIREYPASRRRPAHYAKGNYFACHAGKPFRHLVYPMPNDAGLGIHATLDLDGSTRFGPDVEWVATPDLDVDGRRAASFYAAIREYWPGLPEGALQPAYAGIRPKLGGPGSPPEDFVIEGPAEHRIAGLINLLGIESPGLTACLALGDEVAARCAA